MTDRKPQDQDKFVLRLPDGMRDRIKATADSNNRSMNAEIIGTLESAYPEPKPTNEYDVLIALVLKDGKERVLRRHDSSVHFNISQDGESVIVYIDNKAPPPLRDPYAKN